MHKINVFDGGDESRCEAVLGGTTPAITVMMQDDTVQYMIDEHGRSTLVLGG